MPRETVSRQAREGRRSRCRGTWVPGPEMLNPLSGSLHALGGSPVYVNFTAEAGPVQASYGDKKYLRLRALKTEYDPANLFRLNQNVAG